MLKRQRTALGWVMVIGLTCSFAIFSAELSGEIKNPVIAYIARSDDLSLGIGFEDVGADLGKGIPMQIRFKNFTQAPQDVISDSAVMIGSYEINLHGADGKTLDLTASGKAAKMRAAALISARRETLEASQEMVVHFKLTDLFDITPGTYYLEATYTFHKSKLSTPKLCFTVSAQ